jgi:imidazoleglycerol phosphate synthase glutamine amidotransferase subunit HisH
VTDDDLVLATCEYGGTVTAAVGAGTVVAVQFHPEKSGEHGRVLMQSFVADLPSAVPA